MGKIREPCVLLYISLEWTQK